MQTPKRNIPQLTEEQSAKLKEVRAERAFDPEKYVQLKTMLLASYMRKAGLKAAIVAMSGGIDSAVVLGLLHYASTRSEIKPIAISLPSYGNRGVVDQDVGADLSRYYANQLGVQYVSIDVNESVEQIGAEVAAAFNCKLKDLSSWCYGQLSPYVRTPHLYFAATVQKELGMPAVIVGTTNRDEGSYLGYVGKASDGMVDIQLISDLHKSEVRAVAEYLKVPREIIDAVPKGDMFDGKTDEEIFGATYDFVELYATHRDDSEAGKNLEELHKYNAHKYLVGSPAVHLDIQESGVEGGWPLQFESKFWKKLEQFFPEDFGRLHTEYIAAERGMQRFVEIDNKLYRIVGVCKDQHKRFFPEYRFIDFLVCIVLEEIPHYGNI